MFTESLRPPRAAVVTALPLECDAVLAHLADIRQEVHPVGAIYRIGRLQGLAHEWEVATVIAGMHNVQAAIETERVIAHWEPEVLFFCGIAGGLKDVALGDVVAATKVYWYEPGKDERDLKPRPEVSESSFALVQRAMVVASERRWLERAGYAQGQRGPSALVRPIAAGSKVVASYSSQSYMLLRQFFSDALAVDMESYGFLRAMYAHPGLPALTVRGISDVIEAKTEADAGGGQPRAAAHAAAFTLQVLAELTSTSKIRPVSQSDSEPAMGRLTAMEQLAVALYPRGPMDSEIWSRAGGDIGRLHFAGSGRADWHSAFRLLENGGGGEAISPESLLVVMRTDFPNHAGLSRLA